MKAESYLCNVEFPVLNLPECNFRIKEDEASRQIFDFVRKRFVTLTPEEWVRQHFLSFMVHDKNYPSSLMGVEMAVKVNDLPQRADIVVYNKAGKPWMIIECKAPAITLDEKIFYQAARYNMTLQVPYIVITNGLEHYCLHFNGIDFEYLADLPQFDD